MTLHVVDKTDIWIEDISPIHRINDLITTVKRHHKDVVFFMVMVVENNAYNKGKKTSLRCLFLVTTTLRHTTTKRPQKDVINASYAHWEGALRAIICKIVMPNVLVGL